MNVSVLHVYSYAHVCLSKSALRIEVLRTRPVCVRLCIDMYCVYMYMHICICVCV